MSGDSISERLGRRLRQRRRVLELTQAQLAARCGLTFQLIHKYEAGIVHMSVDRLIVLADALRMPLHEILDGLQTSARAEERHAVRPAAPVVYLRDVTSGDHALSA
jgi:transcriptional regulator with XRE-family HTH domain